MDFRIVNPDARPLGTIGTGKLVYLNDGDRYRTVGIVGKLTSTVAVQFDYKGNMDDLPRTLTVLESTQYSIGDVVVLSVDTQVWLCKQIGRANIELE